MPQALDRQDGLKRVEFPRVSPSQKPVAAALYDAQDSKNGKTVEISSDKRRKPGNAFLTIDKKAVPYGHSAIIRIFRKIAGKLIPGI